jgi:hypothetical protein
VIARILLDLLIAGALLGLLARLTVRYVPPVRRWYQRGTGRHLEERAALHCRRHGDIDPVRAARTVTGAEMCPECYSTLLKREFGTDA